MCMQMCFSVIYTFLFSSEADAGPVPLPNEKSLKEKKKKLEDTLKRVVSHFVSAVLPSLCCRYSSLVHTPG